MKLFHHLLPSTVFCASLVVLVLCLGLQLLSRLVTFVFNLLTLRKLRPEDNGVNILADLSLYCNPHGG